MQPSLLGMQTPRTRQASRQRPTPSGSLRIEEIALHGFERANSDQVHTALQRSLGAALQAGASQGTDALRFERNTTMEKMNGTLDLPAHSHSSDIGTALGKTLAQSLRQTGTPQRGIQPNHKERR